MEFDISRVYTAVNADELKVGSKVICADDLADLKIKVETDSCEKELSSIEAEESQYRFKVNGTTSYTTSYALAYLVSEPEKLKWTDLKIGDVIRSKDGNSMTMITRIDKEDPSGYERHVYDGFEWYDDEKLAEWEKVENDD